MNKEGKHTDYKEGKHTDYKEGKHTDYKEGNNGNTEIWLQNLESFLYNILKSASLIEENERKEFFNEINMPIWVNAFTHETYSPSENYEDLEYIGDAILKSVFPCYLRALFPKLNRAKYTEINVAYMSKMQQANLSRKMGLRKYIRVANEIEANLKLESDVFESFFGALFETSNNVESGYGYTCCHNMIIYLFKDIAINQEIHKGAHKSRVLQIFSRFKLEKLHEQISEIQIDTENTKDFKRKSNIQLQVCLNPTHKDFLLSKGVKLDTDIIGLGIASTKESASVIAYENALKFLQKMGITTEWAIQEKNKLDFSDPEILKYHAQYTKRLKEDGYVDINFFVSSKTRDKFGAIVQIRGIKKDGTEQALKTIYTNDVDTSYRNAKISIIRDYSLYKN
jgi:dsRNA-specific ribonuclease